MYIKIGNSSINYPTTENDSFMIFGEVVNSSLSYEKPVLVKTTAELDIWFGRDFPDYEFFCELISNGHTLYLYKPISTNPNDKYSGYVDYDSFPESELMDQYSLDIGKLEEGIVYRIMEDDGYYHDDLVKWNRYVLINESLVNIRDLPQNVDGINSQSILNKDTLRLMYPNYENIENIPYCYMKTWSEDYIEKPNIHRVEKINLEKINNGYQTLAFKVDYLTAKPREDSFIILPRESDGQGILFYFTNKPEEPELRRDYVGSVRIESLADLFENKIASIGYKFNKKKSLLTTSFPVPVTYFYDIPDFSLTPDMIETHNILSDYTEGNGRIEFISKTIGTGGNWGDIEIEIENTGNNFYRITASRFDYTEVHEGYLYDDKPTPGYERIDHKINKDSKIINCNIIDQWFDEETGRYMVYNDSNRDRRIPELPIGKWKMKRAVEEDVETREMYRKALEEMVTLDNDSAHPDFILIPNINAYGPEDFGNELMELMETANCQALVENDEENYIYNQKGDVNNRIVYFYKDMIIKGHQRPGYYLFITGLLSDDYSMSCNDLLYYGPVTASSSVDPYETSATELEEHKSNYLIDNGHKYYYKCFFDGDNYTMTGLMRFVVGKVGRELEKHKWEFIGVRMLGTLREDIDYILKNIVAHFSIAKEITLVDFNLDPSNYKLELSVDIGINDLIKSNITVDIIINYTKNIE